MKTFKTIFLLCILYFTVSISLNAQIVFTEVSPNSIVNCTAYPHCTASVYIDLNNDGTPDFTIWKSFNATGSCLISYTRTISISVLDSNAVANFSGSTYPSYPANMYTAVSSSTSMISGGTLRHATQSFNCMNGWGTISYTGNFQGAGYIGVKLVKNGLTYYGWIYVAISMPSSSQACSCTIYSYAYNSIPNQPINPGETTCTTPTINLTQSGSLSFCAGDSVTFTANGTGYQYQWKKNNVNITGATSKKYAAKTAGVYKCKVTNSCGSKTSGTRTVTVPCRISDENIVETFEHLSVYPNPATNSVTVKFPSDEAGEIQIVSLFGQIVYSEKVNTEQKQINVSKFSEGMYVVRWSSGENFETKTFSVIK